MSRLENSRGDLRICVTFWSVALASLLVASPSVGQPLEEAEQVAPAHARGAFELASEASPPVLEPVGPPLRFAGWFQPWTLAVMVTLPLLGLLAYRRRSVANLLRSRAWKAKARDDS